MTFEIHLWQIVLIIATLPFLVVTLIGISIDWQDCIELLYIPCAFVALCLWIAYLYFDLWVNV